MIPKWVFELMAEDRARSDGGLDEHGEPEEEFLPIRRRDYRVLIRQIKSLNEAREPEKDRKY